MNLKFMNRKSTPLGRMLALLVSSVVLNCSAQDAVPKLINYQGRLTDAAGQPLPNGIYSVKLEIFAGKDTAQPGGTNVIWGATYTNVVVVSGQFNVVLGAAGGTSVSGAAVNDLV